MTFGTYTTEAKRFAQENDIELVDRRLLLEMIESTRKTHTAQTITTTESNDAPSCPLCGSKMILRTARKGANCGNNFWGCSSYPACRGIR